MTRYEITASTMGRSSPASVGSGRYYRWRGLCEPGDPRYREPAPRPASEAVMDGVRALGRQSSAGKAARVAEFARLREGGLTVQEAGRRLVPPVSPKTARAYERQIKKQQQEGEEAESPFVIVSRLHAEIAARSPKLAALVADFEAIPRTLQPGPWGLEEHNSRLAAERDERMRKYAALRASGTGKKQARLQMGLSESVGNRYEADMHLVGGEAS